MKLIYIAGPFRAPTHWGIEQNCYRAQMAAAEVWRQGMAAICPHMNSRHLMGEVTDDTIMAGCLEMVARCDAILVLRGWEQSDGARMEIKHARELEKPIVVMEMDQIDVAVNRVRIAANQ